MTFRIFPAHYLARFVFGSLSFFPLASAVHADADDTFNAYLTFGGQQESNLFRQPANEQSDTVQTTALTLALSKPFSQQRFSLDATLIDYRYSKNDYLDYQAKNYNATWNWALTHRLSGILMLSQTEAQNSFVDYTANSPQTRRNIRTTQVHHAGAEWKITEGWRLLGGLTNNEQRNSEIFNAQSSYSLDTREAGVKYIWPAGNSLKLLRREGSGEYKNQNFVGFDRLPAPFNPQFDNGFRQIDTEALLTVPLTGKTSLSAKLARQSREHEHFSQRDYGAYTGRLDYTWQPTGQIALMGGLRREVAAYQDFASSYYLSDGVFLQPTWQISFRLQMTASYDWQQRRFDGAIVAGQPDRKDTLQSARLGITWFPATWATLTASYQRDSRNSTLDRFDFSANIYSLNARFSF